MELKTLLSFDWDKFVGRRQPPLRGALVYEGFIAWLKKRYNHDFSYLFLNFSKKNENVTTDSFVNQQLEGTLKDFIREDLQRDIRSFQKDIKEFAETTQTLLKFSKSLITIAEDESKFIFEKFCKVWRDFAPGLLFVIFLEDVCTDEIVKEFADADKDQAKTKLMQIISGSVDSKLFNHKKEVRINNKNISFFKKSQGYIQLLVDIAKYRDWRKVVYDGCWYKYSAKYLKSLGVITGFNDHIDWVSPLAIKDALLKKKKFVFENEALVYFDSRQKGVEIVYGKHVITLKQKIISLLAKDVISGMTACLGKAIGRVKIVEPHAKGIIFEKGNVLVSKMTTPDLMPIIKRAAAIITDEGGVTSHAAIISRELKIPCIIGTKIATQVFKDGDLVKVDADVGVVKRL